MKRSTHPGHDDKRRRPKPNDPIKKVLRRPVTDAQRAAKVPEWQRITPETQRLLDELSNARTARAFLRRYRTKLDKVPVAKDRLGLLPPHIRIIDVLLPERLFCWLFCRPRLRVRKNQRNLSMDEWLRFKGAVDALKTNGVTVPSYQDFVDVHVQAMTTPAGHMWGAHGASNFLPWHREYLFALESRLRLFNPAVTIPYWDWSMDQTVPAQLSAPADLTRWGVTRNTNIINLPTPTQVANTLAQTTWASFRGSLEGLHNTVHVRVGGNMGGAGSPADPLFWLHHAFVDKLWADWQKINTGAAAQPGNPSEILQPPPLLLRTVAQTLDTRAMGFVYVN